MTRSHFEPFASGLVEPTDGHYGPYDTRFIDEMAARGFPVDRMLRKLLTGYGVNIRVEDTPLGRNFAVIPSSRRRAAS